MKKPEKKKTVRKAVAPKTKQEPQEITRTERDERLDFGGIPNRNLKKNLGC